jgi:hypothetical protein
MCGKKKNFSGTESPVEESQGREVEHPFAIPAVLSHS